LQLGYPDKAIPLLSKFAELRQESTLWRTDVYLEEVLYYLGEAYLANDQPSFALQSLDLALEIDHTDADAHFLLGQAYGELGMVEQAT
ncbi:MAG: tetratricopeptide repeat protein, partial [Gammaproteobacteria bacterium]|nr:tetratricopeptide repeat protein [candidate division Zixibacteria bacterium]NIR92421.1 tetratricopeptide repeat protein [Gammaproteobacteria bacterium]NIR62907.1 tetratricopeptide repeat protein [candidate division Zixibacteria bacterium]NIS46984.1 tetratricopeptide repeat protein [candidate division Zixibacteria bacterium]NIU15136.1 tetratricopeptide repeat protein [candidate division Zixibacteria bacterium]